MIQSSLTVWIRLASIVAAITTAAGSGAVQFPGEHVRIALVGDSTVAEGGGWGPGFRAAFGPDVEVLNFAQNGRSSKSFLAEGFWQPALAARPHYVVIQFGHNDNPGKGADRETDPATTYRANLTRYLDEARAAGALPILATSIVRRNLGEGGTIVPDANVPYVEEVRRLAAARHVPLMDLHALTLRQCEQLGRAGCEALGATTAAGALDTTHLGPAGQREVGALAAAEFLRVVLPGASADSKTIAAATLLPLNRARTTFPMPLPRDPRLPSLVVIGDSTVRNGQGDGAGGALGWGDALSDHFDTSRINLVNRAISGLSSRTYLTFGHWDRVLALLKDGDVLLVQFGHNDASAINSPTRARGTLPGTGADVTTIDNQMTGEKEDVHTYGWYLRQIVLAARAKGASVVVCSPVPRNVWKDGRVARNDDYRTWAQEVARANGAGFVDLNSLVAERYDALGAAAVRSFFPADDTHTSRAGAELTAATLVAALEALPASPVAPFLSPRAKRPRERRGSAPAPRSESPAAAGAAAARDAGDAFGVVVVGQLLALANVTRREDPDVMAVDLDVAVRVAGVVDVASDVAAERRVACPPRVDREDPDPLPRQIPELAARGLGLRHQLALVLDDPRVSGDRLAGVDAPAGDRRAAADDAGETTGGDTPHPYLRSTIQMSASARAAP